MSEHIYDHLGWIQTQRQREIRSESRDVIGWLSDTGSSV